jgi:predicted transcriptional regulator
MATSIKLDPTMLNRIQKLADLSRRTPHWIMREAIELYVAREEARETFKAEAEASWIAFQETGLHLTLEETSAWLAGWGGPDETAAPECHE